MEAGGAVAAPIDPEAPDDDEGNIPLGQLWRGSGGRGRGRGRGSRGGRTGNGRNASGFRGAATLASRKASMKAQLDAANEDAGRIPKLHAVTEGQYGESLTGMMGLPVIHTAPAAEKLPNDLAPPEEARAETGGAGSAHGAAEGAMHNTLPAATGPQGAQGSGAGLEAAAAVFMLPAGGPSSAGPLSQRTTTGSQSLPADWAKSMRAEEFLFGCHGSPGQPIDFPFDMDMDDDMGNLQDILAPGSPVPQVRLFTVRACESNHIESVSIHFHMLLLPLLTI